MATNGKGTGMVGYNVQTAVDPTHHLIVAHEVTNVGHDRAQLSPMAKLAKEEMGERNTPVLVTPPTPICADAGATASTRSTTSNSLRIFASLIASFIASFRPDARRRQ